MHGFLKYGGFVKYLPSKRADVFGECLKQQPYSDMVLNTLHIIPFKPNTWSSQSCLYLINQFEKNSSEKVLRSYIIELMRKTRTEINTFQWSSIRSSPFNVYRINVIPSLVSTGAIILSMFSTRWCHYARKNAILGPGDEASEVDIGLYTYAHEGSWWVILLTLTNQFFYLSLFEACPNLKCATHTTTTRTEMNKLMCMIYILACVRLYLLNG